MGDPRLINSRIQVEGEKRTRSSPIGPAEHDEGGSLVKNNQQPLFPVPRLVVDISRTSKERASSK